MTEAHVGCRGIVKVEEESEGYCISPYINFLEVIKHPTRFQFLN